MNTLKIFGNNKNKYDGLHQLRLSLKLYNFIFLILFSVSCIKAEQKGTTAKMMMTGGFESAWKEIPGFSEYVATIDSTNIIKTTKISQKNGNDIDCKIVNGTIFKTNESDTITISFAFKSNNIASADLVVQSYDNKGVLFYSDSIPVNSNTNVFEQISIKQACFNTGLLRFTMHIKGDKGKLNQEYQFTDMKFEYPKHNIQNNIVRNKEDIIPLSFENSSFCNNIPNLNNTKILALGESIHGSLSISQSVIQIMKHRVLHANCKLILLELPLDATLGINRYVQGDTRYGLETMNSLKFALYPNELINFFDWLKSHNDTKTEKDKVRILGIDTPSADFFSFCNNLFSYFYPILKGHLDNREIKKFLRELLEDSNKALTVTFPNLMANKELSSIQLCKEDAVLLQEWFTNFTTAAGKQFYGNRELIMYKNICLFIEQICLPKDNVTIYSHLAHACSMTSNSLYGFSGSFGTLMKEKYASSYSTLGFITKSGSTLILSFKGYENQLLKSPPANSIEAMLAAYGKSYFYRSVAQFDFPVYIRYGQYFTGNDFNIIYPQQYLDGVIYMENSTPIEIYRHDTSSENKIKETISEYRDYLKLVS